VRGFYFLNKILN